VKTNKQLGFMGIDQYGQHYIIDKYPRKELLKLLGRQHASKMYVDTVDDKIKHKGYVIAGRWIEIYRVLEWKQAV